MSCIVKLSDIDDSDRLQEWRRMFWKRCPRRKNSYCEWSWATFRKSSTRQFWQKTIRSWPVRVALRCRNDSSFMCTVLYNQLVLSYFQNPYSQLVCTYPVITKDLLIWDAHQCLEYLGEAEFCLGSRASKKLNIVVVSRYHSPMWSWNCANCVGTLTCWRELSPVWEIRLKLTGSLDLVECFWESFIKNFICPRYIHLWLLLCILFM